MGSRPEVDETYAQYIVGQTMDWSRLGYVQVVREHGELCSAVMLLSDLHRMKSPAKRILMFPKLWLATSVDYAAAAENSRETLWGDSDADGAHRGGRRR
jgi:hypothetical protein